SPSHPAANLPSQWSHCAIYEGPTAPSIYGPGRGKANPSYLGCLDECDAVVAAPDGSKRTGLALPTGLPYVRNPTLFAADGAIFCRALSADSRIWRLWSLVIAVSADTAAVAGGPMRPRASMTVWRNWRRASPASRSAGL